MEKQSKSILFFQHVSDDDDHDILYIYSSVDSTEQMSLRCRPEVYSDLRTPRVAAVRSTRTALDSCISVAGA